MSQQTDLKQCRRIKALLATVLVVLLVGVGLLVANLVRGPETKIVYQPAPPAPTTPAVAPTPPPEVQVEVKEVVPQWVIDLQKVIPSGVADIPQWVRNLLAENAALKARLGPELIVPRTWSSFTGVEAMNLALTTFGNIRIKVLFSEGSVPLISEATTLIAQKPPDLTLSAWIGRIEQARNWPVGMATPNQGDWGTEVFLAKDSNGTVRYYYLAQITGQVMPVDSAWVKANNIYWVFIDTPALRK